MLLTEITVQLIDFNSKCFPLLIIFGLSTKAKPELY
jgi:hypothetical protein